MDKLPSEVLLQIIEKLCVTGNSYLAPYATVSRSWQDAVERETFRRLKLSSLELDVFESLLTPARYQYLKHIEFGPCALIEAHSNSLELVKDVQDQFSRSMSSFLQILGERDGGESVNTGTLTLTMTTPKVLRRGDVIFVDKRQSNRGLQKVTPGTSLNLKHLHSVPLDLGNHLQGISKVTSLDISRRSLLVDYSPAAVTSLTRLCPNLRELIWQYAHLTRSSANNAALVSAVRSLNLPHVNTIFLGMDDSLPSVYTATHLDLSSSELDVVRIAWEKFSTFQKLVQLNIFGEFGPESFGSWTWPCLKNCQLSWRVLTPDGQRHFLRHPHSQGDNCGYESDDDPEEAEDDSEAEVDESTGKYWHYSYPNPATIPGTIASLLRATSHMPQMERIHFQNEEVEGTCFGSWFSLTYCAAGIDLGPGYGPDVETEDIRKNRVYFDVGKWRHYDAGAEGQKVETVLRDLDIVPVYLTT